MWAGGVAPKCNIQFKGILQLFVRKIILAQQVDVLPGNHRAVCHSIEKHLPGRGILDLFQGKWLGVGGTFCGTLRTFVGI
jgi:hypothetical protein